MGRLACPAMVIPLRDRNPTRRRPYVLWVLIAINVAVFALLQPHSSKAITLDRDGVAVEVPRDTAFNLRWAGVPCELNQNQPLTVGEAQTRTCNRAATVANSPIAPDTEIFPEKRIWLGPLFSLFLHGSILHILGNLLFLWVFGNNVEDHLGPWWFAAFYVAAGLVATAIQFVLTADSTIPVIGASGAVAGLMGAYLVWWPKAKVLSIVPVLLFIVIEIPAFIVLLVWFGLQFFTASDSGIAWFAHVGGFAFGAFVAALVRLVHPPQPPAVPEVLPPAADSGFEPA
jgi:membrane associated rhomboid family serine protease